jgi:predicted DNA-binding antitoxin AbrB/MazE fold protein
MSRTIEAIVEKDGSLRLLEEVELRAGDRVLVTLQWGDADADETALLSEPLLGEDWNRREEDEAWAHLQS